LLGTPVASFSDANVGAAKAVTLTGLTLGGADAGNYTLLDTAGLTADITADITAPIIVAGGSPADAAITNIQVGVKTPFAGLEGQTFQLAGVSPVSSAQSSVVLAGFRIVEVNLEDNSQNSDGVTKDDQAYSRVDAIVTEAMNEEPGGSPIFIVLGKGIKMPQEADDDNLRRKVNRQ
jgi:hypothetical protein